MKPHRELLLLLDDGEDRARPPRAVSEATSRPRSRTSPARGASRPDATRTSVVLPAPFGPEDADELAGADA